MNKKKFKVEARNTTTKAKKIRGEGLVPGNLYGPEIDSQALKFEKNKFDNLYSQVGESGLVYIQLDKEEVPAMIEEVQLDPLSLEPLHVSFKTINLKEKTRAEIPIEFVGEFELPEAVLVRVRDEVEVEALPTDLPEKFVVDVSKLNEIGQSITVGDLEYDEEKVEIIVAEEGMEAPIVLVQEMEEEEEEEEPIETEIIGEEEEEAVEGEGLEEAPEAEVASEEESQPTDQE